MPPPQPAVWSWEEEKALESAVASLPPPTDGIDAWLGEVALRVPGKTLAEVRRHYGLLVEDVRAIEAGDVPLPNYKDDFVNDHDHGQSSNAHHRNPEQSDRKSHGSALSKSEQDRRKGTPWTEEEHKLFLLGLSKFGKGDWRSISRNFVVSRTPTQVASHAQKYFIRLNSMNRDRRRSSIHDITSIHGGDPSAVGSPRTGAPILATGPPPTIVGTKLHPPPLQPGMPVYGPPPVTGHAMPAMGTPVMLPRGHPPPPHPYAVPMAYPVGPPPTVMRQ